MGGEFEIIYSSELKSSGQFFFKLSYEVIRPGTRLAKTKS